MKSPKSFIKGMCVGVFLSITASAAVTFAANSMFTTSDGMSYEIVSMAIGSKIIPRSSMPGGLPPMIIDGRTYVPLRAAINAVGGDVAWDETTKTASVRVADNIIARQSDDYISQISQGIDAVEFIAHVPIEALEESTVYEYYWTIERAGRSVFNSNISTADSGDSGFILNVESTDTTFTKAGDYSVKLKIRKEGDKAWYTVAQKKYKIG